MTFGDEKFGEKVFEIFRSACRNQHFEVAEHLLRALEQIDRERGDHKLRDKALKLISFRAH
ncbi:MAG: hypothetical protein JJ911_18350 [Rhizobiaceae bacterium]|jgi:hypothetical protein|nr:hypothetical protein [Rhizobiaceae bacterium]